MGVFFQVVATYAPYIYLACGLVALYQLYRLSQVRGERRQAVFSLEREKAVRDLSGIFSVAMVLLVIMGVTYFAASTIPRAAEAALEPEPTLPPQFALAVTPTNTPLPVTPSATPTGTTTPTPEPPTPDPLQATQTSEALANATPTPEPPPEPPPQQQGSSPVCPDPRSVIAAPGNGAVVSGVFNLVGTATHEQFNYYKVEFAPGADAQDGFTYLADGRGQVFDGTLASINSRGFANGPWTFQLTVVDQTGNFPPPCRVTLNIGN